MGEERQEPKDSNDFELQFLRFVSHPLWQRVQLQIEIANRQDGDDQEDAHHHHQNVRFAGRRDETRQMVGSQRMKLIAQMFLHVSIQHVRTGIRWTFGSPTMIGRRQTFDLN